MAPLRTVQLTDGYVSSWRIFLCRSLSPPTTLTTNSVELVTEMAIGLEVWGGKKKMGLMFSWRASVTVKTVFSGISGRKGQPEFSGYQNVMPNMYVGVPDTLTDWPNPVCQLISRPVYLATTEFHYKSLPRSQVEHKFWNKQNTSKKLSVFTELYNFFLFGRHFCCSLTWLRVYYVNNLSGSTYIM